MEKITIDITDERMLKALNTFTSVTGVTMEEVVDTKIVEELLSTYLVEFFLSAMTDISLGSKLRHPNIVTFVAECRRVKSEREKNG